MARLVLGTVGCICLTLLIGAQIDAQDKKDEVVKVDARTLLSDYRQDRKEADRKYKGKVLQVQGVVRNITPNAVNLEGGTDLKLLVQCAFGSGGIKAIREHNVAVRLKDDEARRKKQKVDLPSRIDRGINVVIKGTCGGIKETTGKTVVLDNCEVIDPILLKK